MRRRRTEFVVGVFVTWLSGTRVPAFAREVAAAVAGVAGVVAVVAPANDEGVSLFTRAVLLAPAVERIDSVDRTAVTGVPR